MILFWAALVVPSLAVVAKFMGLAGVVLYSLAVAVALLVLPRILVRVPMRAMPALSLAMFVALVLLFVLVYPRVNVQVMGAGSDDDDAHNVGVAALLAGESPYWHRTYLDNALHQLPGAYVLAAPFAIAGTSALQNLVCLPLFFLLLARTTDRRNAFVVACLVLLLSAAVAHQVATGSSYSWNAIWVILGIWWVWRRPESWIAAMFCGVALCSRPNFLLLLPLVFGALRHAHGMRTAMRSAGLAALTAIALALPFYILSPEFGPAEGFGTLDQFDAVLPHAGLAILTTTALAAIGFSLMRVDLSGLFLQCAIVLALPVFAVLVLSAVVDGGNEWLTLTPYATFASWFVLIGKGQLTRLAPM